MTILHWQDGRQQAMATLHWQDGKQSDKEASRRNLGGKRGSTTMHDYNFGNTTVHDLHVQARQRPQAK